MRSATTRTTRRDFLHASLSAAPLVLSAAGQAQQTPATYIYKRVNGLDIRSDVHRNPGDAVQPVAVWIHGGALINGNRAGVPRRLLAPLLSAGCTIVSIDYRLAPETNLPAIITDVEDAFGWVAGKGPALFGADPRHIAVMGGSAGGYLSLTAGYRVRPRLRAVVSFWGYGDLIGDWYSTPSPHPRHHRITMTREEAYRQVSGPPISDSRDRKGDGGAFYQYCRQHGEWPKAVSTWDPRRDAAKFTPYMPLRNVTSDYPPTLLIHGTADTDVPYEQSVMMAAELEKHGVEHQLITVPGAEHGLAGGDPKLIDAAYDSAVRFLKSKLAL